MQCTVYTIELQDEIVLQLSKRTSFERNLRTKCLLIKAESYSTYRQLFEHSIANIIGKHYCATCFIETCHMSIAYSEIKIPSNNDRSGGFVVDNSLKEQEIVSSKPGTDTPLPLLMVVGQPP